MVAFGSEEDGPRLGILFRDGVFFLSCSVIYLWPLESVVQVHRINPLIIGILFQLHFQAPPLICIPTLIVG